MPVYYMYMYLLSFLPPVCLLQNGLVQGLFNVMLLNISARLTKELGMAPGGEFRQAYKEVSLLQPSSMTSVMQKVDYLKFAKKIMI